MKISISNKGVSEASKGNNPNMFLWHLNSGRTILESRSDFYCGNKNGLNTLGPINRAFPFSEEKTLYRHSYTSYKGHETKHRKKWYY